MNTRAGIEPSPNCRRSIVLSAVPVPGRRNLKSVCRWWNRFACHEQRAGGSNRKLESAGDEIHAALDNALHGFRRRQHVCIRRV
ncbi:MAG: hypothetical protein C4519_11245 [Desulfobacteraceae bacterium]|nr:MAG: hypothetical protein C4519_11245 [Desulfobacteraceae bacterium]